MQLCGQCWCVSSSTGWVKGLSNTAVLAVLMCKYSSPDWVKGLSHAALWAVFVW